MASVALFFTFRELKTFPAPWEDSGLYSMVATAIVRGHGYSLPVLEHYWAYPYFISAGPLVILPAALFIHLFDTARIATALYLLSCITAFYVYCRSVAGVRDARWSTALLVTLSAFVNSGKPVLGTVPGFFFLLLALVVLHHHKPSMRGALVVGMLLACSILTKLTYVLAIPALGAFLLYGNHRSWKQFTSAIVTVTFLIVVPWMLLQVSQQDGFESFLTLVFTRGGGGSVFWSLLLKLPLFLRFQYVYFLGLLALGLLGLRAVRSTISSQEKLFLASLIGLFFVYFLVREGWYRHLLPAHLLLLPFVPAGLRRILPRLWVPILVFFLVVQGLWQLDHRGSTRSLAAFETAKIITQRYTRQHLLIQHPEVYVRLPESPFWLYYPLPGTGELIPKQLLELTPVQRCFPRVRKANDSDRALYGDTLVQLSGGYRIIPPPSDCPSPQGGS